MRKGLHGLRWLLRAGAAWRLRPHDLPPWSTVSQQSPRWRKAGVFTALVHDLREGLRVAQGHDLQPSAALCDSRTLPSTPASGTRAGSEGAQRRRGWHVPRAVETLGPLWAAHVTAANEPDRSPGSTLAANVPEGTGAAIAMASGAQGDPGAQAPQAAEAHHRQLAGVKRPAAKQGCVLLPKRWGGERRNTWAARLRRLARDEEQEAETLQGFQVVAFALLMLKRFVAFIL